ncbi:glycoside hydrolase family 3 protein [Devosia sp. D6-9]|nr:glycoside hydrolase family 3 protein [Devosia sp. D6-9]
MTVIDVDLRKAPFSLDDEAIGWVEATLSDLTQDEKIGQLFVLIAMGDPGAAIADLKRFQPGGVTRFYGPDLAAEIAFAREFISSSKVPPLLSADLEGSRMSLPFGTPVPNPLGLAAVDDVQATSAISSIMAREAREMGLNWSFTPVIDINKAFRSAIVGTRSYGSEVDRIERHALAQIAAFQAEGVAATVKHWPGEGYDDRDQHLVTTINPLNIEDWEASFGKLYRAAIDAGVLSVMSAHIAFPAFIRSLDPDAGLEAYRPASISAVLNQTLLRERLGFNGLIVSDATPMGGLGAFSSRDTHLAELIANGCDVILFADHPEEDFARIRKALASGALSQQRFEDAVRRILGLKARLGLHKPYPLPNLDRARANLATQQSLATASQTTARAPTLVKDTQNLLPLDPARHRRVLVYSGGVVHPLAPAPMPFAIPDMLRAEGFEVTVHAPGQHLEPKDFDLVLYLFGDETLLTRSNIFIDWMKLTGSLGGAMARPWHDVPTLMVSFGYPYLLYDAPRVPTYINAYGTYDAMQQAVVEAMMGRQPFEGSNPVDPFCGLEDARY